MENDPDGRASQAEGTDVVVPPAAPSFRDILTRGLHATRATWLAPVLVFALFGPQQIAGAAVALMVAEGFEQPTPAQPFPRQVLAMTVLGLGNCVGMVVMLFAYPWVLGAAAGRLRDRLVPPERTRSYHDHGQRFYGRSMVLMLFFGAMIVSLSMPMIAMTQYMMHREGTNPFAVGAAGKPDVEMLSRIKSDPAVIATGVAVGLLSAVVHLAWHLCLAATVVEDLDLIGAVRRGFTLLREHPGDGLRLVLTALALLAPPLVLNSTVSESTGLLFVAVMTAIAVYTSYTTILNLSFALSLYLSRRPASLMP